jgi:RimJ/RimL family protein N-acetyltransferase
MIPVLETARLRLRPHGMADFEALASLWADPVVTRFIGGKPATREESWARLLRYSGLWPLVGFGYWLVEDRATGTYLGDVGFADFHRQIDPAPPALPEIGWVLSPAAHGRGVATEAATAALGWLGRDCFCIIDPAHGASLRVAAKLGFESRGLARYRDASVTVLLRRQPLPGVCNA